LTAVTVALRVLDLVAGLGGLLWAAAVVQETVGCEGDLCGLGYYVAGLAAVPAGLAFVLGGLSWMLRRRRPLSFGLALVGSAAVAVPAFMLAAGIAP
jgi:hypothetical protein